MGQIHAGREETLLTQERRQRQQAEVLHQIGTTLSAVLDFDELLDLLIDQLAVIMPDDCVEIIFIVDDITRIVRQQQRPFPNIVRHDITDPRAPTFYIKETRNQRLIIDTGKPLIIPDVKQFKGWLKNIHFPDEFHTWAGVPLFVNNQVQAILAVYSEQIDAYHEKELERLSSFARQAELAIQNAMLYQSTVRQLGELKTLQALTALAAAATNEDELLVQAAALVEKTFITDNFTMLMVNECGTRLFVRSSYHANGRRTNFSSISIDKGITGYTFRTGGIVRTGDVHTHPHYMQTEKGTESELCVPMKADGRILGVINVESAKQNAYSVSDERLLSTVGGQMATAVIKIRLLAREKRRQQETETLRLASNMLVTSLSLNEVLDSILTELDKLIHFDSAGVLLLDEGHVLVAAGSGFPPEIHENLIGHRFPLDESLAVKIITQHAPVLIADMRDEPGFRFWGDTNYIRGWMGAPLVARGEIIGFLTTDSRQVGTYKERDKQIIQAFANQAAIAIENARLFEAEKKARETAVFLRKASMKLAESRDLDTVLGQLLDFLAEVIAYDSANVMLLENNKLVHKVLRGYENWTDPQLIWDIHFDFEENSGFSTIFKNGKAHMINDTSLASDWKKTSTNAYIHSWLGVPLYAGGDVVGCISLDKSETDFFTKEHVQLVEGLATQTAVTIQNSIFFSEVEKTGTLLRILNATPLVIDALPVLTPLIKSTVICQFASISIFDDFSDNTSYKHYVANEDGSDTVTVQHLKVEDTIIGSKVLQGGIVYIPDLGLARGYAVEEERYKAGMRSRVILPLIAGTNVIGSLNLSWSTAYGYDIKRLPLFENIASAIALAVERSDLYDQSRRQESELETLFSVSNAMRVSATTLDILNTLIFHVKTVIEPAFISMMLQEESTKDLIAYSHTDAELSDRKRRVPQGKGICGRVFESGDIYTTKKLMLDPLAQVLPEERTYLPKIGGSITLPLQTQERTIGVVHIGLLPKHTLDEAQIRLLTGIAEITGSALERALMMEILEQRVDARTQALTLANQRLTELDHLKSKFISDVSHELRTPITNLGLYVKLMEQGNAEKQAYYLNVLRMQGKRLKNLVEDILNISRLERLRGAMELTAVNIHTIITTVIQSTTIQSKTEALTLTTAFHPALPLSLSNQDYITQAISNLLSNALNYTNEGTIQISTTVDAENEMICIAVADSGTGIDEQDMPYIFDRFYRGHAIGSSAIPGTGLGLSIVQEIVAMHNGRLTIESEVGKGTTARVWLHQAEM